MDERPIDVVNEQAEDENLWFVAQTVPEAYLQQELRRLHAAVEAAQSGERTFSESVACQVCHRTNVVTEGGLCSACTAGQWVYVGSECQSCGWLQRWSPPPRSCCPEPDLSVPVFRFQAAEFDRNGPVPSGDAGASSASSGEVGQ